MPGEPVGGRGEHRGVGPARPHGDRRLGDGMQAQRDLADHAERAEGSALELCEVVPGDVLDHVGPGPGDRSVGERHPDAEDQVTRAAEAVAQRTGVARREDPADRRAAPAVGRVEGQPLAVERERLLRPGERHARLNDGRQVAVVVGDDLVESPGRELDVGRQARGCPRTASCARRPSGRGRPQPAAPRPRPRSPG